jgi:two-component system sporulation sensor kinase C
VFFWWVLEKKGDFFVTIKEIRAILANIKVVNFYKIVTRTAIEAMPYGGRVEIKTLVSSDEIGLSFNDYGKGNPKHVLQNLGKPFVSTKEFGIGLGMAICYQIINSHNGSWI